MTDAPNCLVCESAAATRVRAVEHRPCGTVRRAGAFRTPDGRTCPDCGGDGGEFVPAGTFFECPDCDLHFDGRTASGRPPSCDPPTPGPDAHPSSAGRDGSAGRTLLVALVVVAVVAAGIGGGVFAASPRDAGARDVLSNGDGGTPADAATAGAGTRSWHTYRTVVVFRNDDIQAGYRADTRAAVHDVFVAEGVPVTDGVIPYIGNRSITKSGSVCEALRERKTRHPDLFEYALHGYTHAQLTEFHGGSEFGGLPPDSQRHRIARGKRILRECTGTTPTTFIPPMDTYDNATVRALDAEGFDTVSGGGWFARAYYGRDDSFTRDGVVHVPNSHAFVENWTTNDLYERKELRRAFDRAYRNGSIYVQMLHYPQFESESNLNRLRWFVQYVKSRDGVRFMTVGELASHVRRGTIERTDEGWRVYESGGKRESGGGQTPERVERPTHRTQVGTHARLRPPDRTGRPADERRPTA